MCNILLCVWSFETLHKSLCCTNETCLQDSEAFASEWLENHEEMFHCHLLFQYKGHFYISTCVTDSRTPLTYEMRWEYWSNDQRLWSQTDSSEKLFYRNSSTRITFRFVEEDDNNCTEPGIKPTHSRNAYFTSVMRSQLYHIIDVCY